MGRCRGYSGLSRRRSDHSGAFFIDRAAAGLTALARRAAGPRNRTEADMDTRNCLCPETPCPRRRMLSSRPRGGRCQLRQSQYRSLSGSGSSARRCVTQWPASRPRNRALCYDPHKIALASFRVTAVRTSLLFGLSDVKVQFTYDYTYEGGGAEGAKSPFAAFAPARAIYPGISPASPTGRSTATAW